MRPTFHKLILKQRKAIAATLLIVMATDLLMPLRALALTSGPSQPEFQAFSPLATTSLVDPFSGDFSYNIPLLEIDGYPLNLVYRATSNVEEEGSWVGYGWNVNVGTLNRMVRGLPDDMDGDLIKNFQSVKVHTVDNTTIGVESHAGVQVGNRDLGVGAGVQANIGMSFDDDNYIGEGVGLSIGAGVYASVNAGPLGASANAGVTLAANSNTGGSISTYAGFNVGFTYNDYVSIGFGRSVNRSFNTISGWEQPNIIGSFNISHLTQEVQRNFINSVSNAVPVVTSQYHRSTDGTAYKLKTGVDLGILEWFDVDLGTSITYGINSTSTYYKNDNSHKGYGYMYSEHASATDMVDFTRDNDGGINKDMPFMAPAMKTFDVFSSTAHNATSVFRADRNDFGTVRDPKIDFKSASGGNETHEFNLQLIIDFPSCILGLGIGYNNIKTSIDGFLASGGCPSSKVDYRPSNGKDQNLFFRPCGAIAQADEAYLAQVNTYSHYDLNKSNVIKGGKVSKRLPIKEPIAVYTNRMIAAFPQTAVSKKLEDYETNRFPSTVNNIRSFIPRTTSGSQVEGSRIGAVLNTNSSGQTYVYGTPVMNNMKNEVGFRINGFNTGYFDKRNGTMAFIDSDATPRNGQVRDRLYRSNITPAYATSYLLNAVLSPDYVDVGTDGITDDDLGDFVKFNYTKTEDDYRWRAPYGDKGQSNNKALLNEGIKATKFDDMGSYVMGSKEVWYAHSIESKNNVVEFYLSPREDAKDSRAKVVEPNFMTWVYPTNKYMDEKNEFSHLQKLDSIKYYSKHDRYLNGDNAVPLKTIYFDYDYTISSSVPNSTSGKLKLLKVRVRHGDEPIPLAETYNFDYGASDDPSLNPRYELGAKDGWGNYCPNIQPIPLCEFPYIDQVNRVYKDKNASVFHLRSISLPSGGRIQMEYEADDYVYVQDKRAMALTQVKGVGYSKNSLLTDVYGLYDPATMKSNNYIYVEKPAGLNGNYKDFLLNGSNLMYFSFNINIAGKAFSKYDQVKGYAEVEEIDVCPDNPEYLYIKVKPVSLKKTNAHPSPMTNTAINTARAFASDLLYFQEHESRDGRNGDKWVRLEKAGLQLADAILGKNSIERLMKEHRAGHSFVKDQSYVKLTMTKPKIGGGSRVSKLTFSDSWQIGGEDSSLVGYHYMYQDVNGGSSGVASYEPMIGGEENPLRSGSSYALTTNASNYPPYDPIEMIKEDPAGESFFPTGSVGYSRVVVESIHKNYARSAQSRLIHEFYTAKDFPYFSTYGPKAVKEVKDQNYPTPEIRDILLSFLGISNTFSASTNRYDIKQTFVVETNDMHGKPKATYNYRLLQKNALTELVSSTQYFYNTDGYNRLTNDIDVLQYEPTESLYKCGLGPSSFPEPSIKVVKKTMGVDVDVCTDSREVVSTEERNIQTRGGGFRLCFFPTSFRPELNWIDNTHKHTDYFTATVTTKIINRYGILKSVKTSNEGAETIMENKYYDGITGEPVVQTLKDKYADDMYNTNIPAYWTKTALEPSYMEYPFYGKGAEILLPPSLTFDSNAASNTKGSFSGNSLLQASFTTTESLLHPGDELFVRGVLSNTGDTGWYRLYVSDIIAQKEHRFAYPDPLAWRYGNGTADGGIYKVFLMPYKVGGSSFGSTEIQNNSVLNNISATFKYRPGRKNMLSASAGKFLSFADPFLAIDSFAISCSDQNLVSSMWLPSFLKPMAEASASRYEDTSAVLAGNLRELIYNPVTLGIIGQPYVGTVYALNGTRQNAGHVDLQRGNGVLRNWFYWLPIKWDSLAYKPIKPLLGHYDNPAFNNKANEYPNAVWFASSTVTKSIPSLGPVEETNPLNIFSSLFLDPLTKQVLHVTANGKFGQTWVETFEDLQRVRKYNSITDLVFSPFQKHMQSSTNPVNGYSVYNTTQTFNDPYYHGSFVIDNTQAHTGISSLKVTRNVSLGVEAKKYNGTFGNYFSSLFDFNLNGNGNEKYTFEVWVKDNDATTAVAAPSIFSNNNAQGLQKISNTIDGWALYRANFETSSNNRVNISLPAGQSYDDFRVFPVEANVKTYVYHPFKNYLMAILDENNNATFYEYNSKNQLVRLKKETEKGIITITENIKNMALK